MTSICGMLSTAVLAASLLAAPALGQDVSREGRFTVSVWPDGSGTVEWDGAAGNAARPHWAVDCSAESAAHDGERNCSVALVSSRQPGAPVLWYGTAARPGVVCLIGHDAAQPVSARVDRHPPMSGDGCIHAPELVDQMIRGDVLATRIRRGPHGKAVDGRHPLLGLTEAMALVDRIRAAGDAARPNAAVGPELGAETREPSKG